MAYLGPITDINCSALEWRAAQIIFNGPGESKFLSRELPLSDIFISYTKEDRPHAERLAHALEGEGWSVWWDVIIPAGLTFDEVIEEALDAARCVIVIWTERSVGRRWVRTEAEEGVKRNILVPVRIEEVDPPLAFRRFQARNLIGWDGSAEATEFRRLVTDIERVLGPSPKREKQREEEEA